MYELYNNYNNYFMNNTDKNIIWNVGIYTRLSREDEKEPQFNKQSESIENQIKFLNGYVKCQGWNIVKTYIDDGFSGTNFDRPDFKNMISDIENKVINMVITKDLSRLGRDYIDTGYYIEKYFPSKHIRYIAVNDNVDTFDANNSNNDMTPFKAVTNDMYAKDTSKKVRTALMTKAVNGESIKSFQPYGYKKDPNNKNRVIVDRVVSENVVRIFDMYKAGKTKKEICNYLNENNIVTPLKYKEETTNYRNPNKRFYIWTNTLITKLLRARIHTGDLEQHKHTKINYKVKKSIKVNPKQHIIIENNHEPIIDKNTFYTVQKMLDKQANEWNYTSSKPHLLKGLVFCSCGARVTYNKNHGKYFRCVCSSYKRGGAKFCNNMQYLREDELISKVLESLKINVNKYLDYQRLDCNRKSNKKKDNNSDEIKKQIEMLDKKIKTIYEDKLNNLISTEMFVTMSSTYEKQKSDLKNILENINTKVEDKKQIPFKKMENYIKEILQFDNPDKIDRTLLLKLIDKIVIENKEIKSITYNFSIPS